MGLQMNLKRGEYPAPPPEFNTSAVANLLLQYKKKEQVTAREKGLWFAVNFSLTARFFNFIFKSFV